MARKGAVLNLKCFLEATKGRGPLLGLDVGRLRCGISISDQRQGSAAALKVVPLGAKPSDALKMAKMLQRMERDFGAIGVVVGWPLEREGNTGEACRKVLNFVQAIRRAQLVQSPWTFWDERYTSVRARSHAHRATNKRVTNALLQKEDAVAATLILQTFLSECVWTDGGILSHDFNKEYTD